MKATQIKTPILGAWFAFAFCATAEALTQNEQADAFLARGIAAEKRGEMVAAENCYVLALRVIPNHRTTQVRLAELEKTKPSPEERAKTVIVPRVMFKDVTTTEGFEWISKQTGIKIFYVPGKADKRITVTLASVPASKLIDVATQLAGLTFTYEKEGIRVFSAATKAKLDELDAQFRAALEPATAPAIQAAQTNYKSALQRTLETASRYADAAALSALQQESRRIKDSVSVPDTDASGTPAILTGLRATFRSSIAAAARSPEVQPLYERYDASLASLAEGLTERPGDAGVVTSVRSQLMARRVAAGIITLPNAIAIARADALKKYPPLGQNGSEFNVAFAGKVKRYQSEKSDFFKDPMWPLKLADELEAERLFQTLSIPAKNPKK